MEVMVKSKIYFLIIALIFGLGFIPAFAQLKVGYVNSQQVLEKYEEALDVRKQLAELNTQWESEARDMQKEIEKLQDELESQSLLLSDQRKQEKVQQIQTLGQQYQLFLQTKWGQQGEGVKKEVELLQPVYEKINAAIKEIGQAEEIVNGVFLYRSRSRYGRDRIDQLCRAIGRTAGLAVVAVLIFSLATGAGPLDKTVRQK